MPPPFSCWLLFVEGKEMASKEELFAMLGLSDKLAAPVASAELESTDCEDEDMFDPSLLTDTVLRVNEWDMEQGCRVRDIAALPLSNDAAGDFYAAAFNGEPEVVGTCYDQLRQQYLEALLETSEYRALHATTCYNVLASEAATRKFAAQYLALRDKRKKRQEQGRPMDQKEQQRAAVMAASRAAEQAQEEVEETLGMCHALGCGDGIKGEPLDVNRIGNLFRRVRNSARLRAIIEKAGRFRLTSQALQRRKVQHGYDDMIGTEMSGDVSRLLPVELAMLADEELEDDAMRRLVERQSQCRQYRGVERVGKGPIVVTVDESGSMSGEKIENAKAFALTMAYVAQHQNRWCCLVGFAGGTEGNVLVLRPGSWDQEALLGWLEHFYGGGTTMDVPLGELPKMWSAIGAPKGKTDLIIVTDAVVRVPTALESSFKAWKVQEKVRTISLVLERSAGDMEKVSDEVHLMGTVSVDQPGVTACLGL
jgi:uncharacterized protein with von Willebrand factor type A (vWA) domain